MSWSYPSPYFNPETGKYESDGMVWMGVEPADDKAYEDLYAHSAKGGIEREDVAIDERSVCGLYHRDWNSHWHEKNNTPPEQKPGGLGSPTYEGQYLLYGVTMRKEPVWHFNLEGQRVCEVPQSPHGDGACHERYVDGYDDLHAGAEPDSDMARVLDQFGWHIYWDDHNALWVWVPSELLPAEPEEEAEAAHCPSCGEPL